VSREAPYASIDIHNNTGNNPALRLRYKSQRQRSASSASFQPYHRRFQKTGGCTGGSTRRNLPGGHDRVRPAVQLPRPSRRRPRRSSALDERLDIGRRDQARTVAQLVDLMCSVVRTRTRFH